MSLQRDLHGIHAIWLREFKIFQRERSRVVSALASPLLWLFLLGTGLRSTASTPEGVDYYAYIFPGVALMSVLFQGMFFGLYIVWDRKIDVLKAVLVSPVSRPAVFFGKVLGGCTDVTIQAAILLLIGLAVIPDGHEEMVRYLALYPVAVALVVLIAVGLVSVGLTIGSFFESLEGFQVFITFLAFPMFFLSGALYSLEGLPPWFSQAVTLNPMTYAVDALRWLLVPAAGRLNPAVDLAVISGFGMVMVLVGSWSFRRMR